MSIWADQQIKELRQEVKELKVRLTLLENPVPRETSVFSDLKAAYQAKFGKPPHHLMKDETIAARLK